MSDADLADLPVCVAPESTHRLVPSRFPPVQTFDMAETPVDLAAVMELEGWTNDRLSAPRLRRLPEHEWVHGRANASVVMAAFLHGSPEGMRFTSPALGAWYAASSLVTAMTEVLSGLRRELARSALVEKTEEYREYAARLGGDYVDIRGMRPDLHEADPAHYPHSQRFGEAVRASDRSGIAYDSVLHPGGENWVCYRPSHVDDVRQARHFRVILRLEGKAIIETLS